MRVASHPAARASRPGRRARGARGARSPRPRRRLPRVRAAEDGRVDPADKKGGARAPGDIADDVPAALRAWCAATRGGVDATVADIDALRHLVTSAETASCVSSDVSSAAASSARWRLLGASQRTEPSPGSWLASPFFWFAKEAQHESYALAVAGEERSGTSRLVRLVARLSAGWDDPMSGERWVSAFGARRATAAFPFSVVEGALNAFETPFKSGDATVAFASEENENVLLESRVHVRFGDDSGKPGRSGGVVVVGDLVTRCALEKTNETADGSFSVVRLVSTAFENALPRNFGFGRALESVVVPSGALMGALMSPSERLRARNDASGKPGLPYRVAVVGDVVGDVEGDGDDFGVRAIGGASLTSESIVDGRASVSPNDGYWS